MGARKRILVLSKIPHVKATSSMRAEYARLGSPTQRPGSGIGKKICDILLMSLCSRSPNSVCRSVLLLAKGGIAE